jgi:hypothetical protein
MARAALGPDHTAMSTTAVTTAVPPAAATEIMGIPRSLGGALRRLGADTLYLGLGLPMGILTFTWVVTGWSLSLGLMITLIGLPLAVVTIIVSRALATVERQRAALVLGSAVPSGTAGRSGRASWPSSGPWSATPRPGRTSPGTCCCCPSGSRASRSPSRPGRRRWAC